MLFTVASVYTARCFGPANVGRLHGMSFTLATTFSFGNYYIVSATNAELEGDFTTYSLCSLLATVPCVPMLCWLEHSRLRPLAEALERAEAASKEKKAEEQEQKAEEEEGGSAAATATATAAP
jgi:hypothetical protein